MCSVTRKFRNEKALVCTFVLNIWRKKKIGLRLENKPNGPLVLWIFIFKKV